MTSCEAIEEYESLKRKEIAIKQAVADRIDRAINAVIHGWRPRPSTVLHTSRNAIVYNSAGHSK